MPYIWERVRRQKNAYLVSLDDEAPARRVQAWRDLMNDRAMEVSRGIDTDTVKGSILGQAFDGGALGRWTLSAQEVRRTHEVARKFDDEFVFISVNVDGRGALDQAGATTELHAGDFAVIDGTRPFSATTAADINTRGFLLLPKSALRKRLGSRQDLAFGVYRPQQPLDRLASSFLISLTNLVGEVDRTTLTALVEQSIDIVALLANNKVPGAVDPSTHQSAMLLRLKLHMKSHLKDPTYTIQVAAASLGVSTRYVNMLLSLEGISFGRRLLDARLDAARHQIIDPIYVHRQITETAYDWGFNNVSHFGKAFKDRFGIAPREAKMASMFEIIGSAA